MCLAINSTLFPIIKCCFQYGKMRKIMLLLFSKMKYNVLLRDFLLLNSLLILVGELFQNDTKEETE